MSKQEDKGKRLFHDIKCIWMESNNVGYKLCDRGFDCENCSFDKAIRNAAQPASKAEPARSNDVIQRIIDHIGSEELNSNYTYLQNHLVLKNLFNHTFYLGLSPLAMHLLDQYSSVEYCVGPGNVSQGDRIIEIKGDWGSVDITSPMSFTCLGKINTEEKEDSLVRWFSLIKASEEEMNANTLPVSDYHRDIVKVTKKITQIQLNYPDVGYTMMDGGIKLQFLYQIIGTDNYLNILNSLFNKSK
ncbi:MAG TPA: hypothetical protein VHO43_12905 [Ignavibacteriales bacterium]|nr:hypothetical protein [Ignavibacteriales bacterium]